MGFPIGDGKGKYGDASVSVDQRLDVTSRSNPRSYYVSRDEGRAFSTVSIDGAAAANDIISYLQNTSTNRRLVIKDIRVGAANAVLWKLWKVTGTAAGSSALTPRNLNVGSGNSAEATARGDGAITGLTQAELLGFARHVAGGRDDFDAADTIILSPNDAIGVEYDTGTGGVAEVEIDFYYEPIQT